MPAATPGGALCISLDFELFWGMRDHSRLEDLKPRLRGTRQAIPRMLDAFAAAGVHATWATVGALLCEDKDELLASLPARLPQYHNPRLSPWEDLDTIGADERRDPFRFAPSLVERILQTPGQELGCHTFGHYYCLEGGQTLQDFEADLDAALSLAERRGLTLRSLVLPRNQIDPSFLPAIRQRGFLCYRGLGAFFAEEGRGRGVRLLRLLNAHAPISGSMAWPLQEAGSEAPLNIRASHFLRPFSPRLVVLRPLQLRRLEADMVRAARTGRVLHLWWHPHNFGLSTQENMAGLQRLLQLFTRLRESHGMQSLHMTALAERALAQTP